MRPHLNATIEQAAARLYRWVTRRLVGQTPTGASGPIRPYWRFASKSSSSVCAL